MVSFRGQFINWYFTRIGFKNGMARDIARGNRRAAEPTPKVMRRNFVERRKFQGRDVWYIYPKSGKSQNPERAVIFFHGGAYYYDVMDLHFAAWAKIADASDTLVILPSYPLAPEASAEGIGGYSQGVQHEVVVTLPKECKIIAGGDSAGAGLAMQMCQRLAKAGLTQPDHLLLWSPWADISRDNPALIEQDKRSVIIGLEGSQKAAELYRGELDAKDPVVSPIFGDLSVLPPTTIVTGSRDLLHPDILRLNAAMVEAGVTPDLQIWPGQNHYFMYLPQPEAKRVYKRTADLIRSI